LIYNKGGVGYNIFFSIASKISILANMVHVFMIQHGNNKFFFVCSIASMILGALAAMVQNKVKKLLAFSSIESVGYFFYWFFM
jgi:NADH-ubiquinone oxidoreductase chain 2